MVKISAPEWQHNQPCVVCSKHRQRGEPTGARREHRVVWTSAFLALPPCCNADIATAHLQPRRSDALLVSAIRAMLHVQLR